MKMLRSMHMLEWNLDSVTALKWEHANAPGFSYNGHKKQLPESSPSLRLCFTKTYKWQASAKSGSQHHRPCTAAALTALRGGHSFLKAWGLCGDLSVPCLLAVAPGAALGMAPDSQLQASPLPWASQRCPPAWLSHFPQGEPPLPPLSKAARR